MPQKLPMDCSRETTENCAPSTVYASTDLTGKSISNRKGQRAKKFSEMRGGKSPVEDESHSIIHHTLTKDEREDVVVDVEIVKDCQHSHCRELI